MNRPSSNYHNQHQKYLQPQHQTHTQFNSYMKSSDTNKSNESDLIIFNGQPSDKGMFVSHEKIQHPSHQYQHQTVVRSNSQRRLPVIFGNREERHTNQPRQMEYQNHRQQRDEVIDPNYSEVFQYGQGKLRAQMEGQLDTNGFPTFKNLPSEDPPTAHFLPPSQQEEVLQTRTRNLQSFSPRNDRVSSPPHQPMQFLSLPDEKRQYQPFQKVQGNHSRPMSKVISPISIPPTNSPHNQAPLSPRVNFQNTRPAMSPSNGSSSIKMIQIPQQEYQKFIDHLPMCKKSQDQILRLRGKSEQLGQKQHFYWQQNMTLRQQNKRLRDLVSHFEKRQNELLKSRQEFRQSNQNMINRYRQSSLEEMNLLFQRYRLQLQKGKVK